jgi:hypothetical protein
VCLLCLVKKNLACKEIPVYGRSIFDKKQLWLVPYPWLNTFFIFKQGYSSLAVALALPESGCLVACERDERCLEVAKKYYHRAGVAHKVTLV